MIALGVPEEPEVKRTQARSPAAGGAPGQGPAWGAESFWTSRTATSFEPSLSRQPAPLITIRAPLSWIIASRRASGYRLSIAT